MADFDLELAIRSTFSPQGVAAAKAGAADLAGATNAATAATKAQTVATEGLIAKQEVSKREIKIFTRELLANIGATHGAGAGGRVAAEAFAALGNSAHIANLAIAGGGLAIVTLIPYLIELSGKSKQAKEEHQKLIDAIVNGLPDLEHLADSIGHVSQGLERQIAATRLLALEAQKEHIEKLNEEIKALREQLPLEQVIVETRVKAAAVLDAFTKLEKEQTRELTEQEKKEQQLRLQLEEKLGLRQRLQEAADKGLTLDRLDEEETKRKTDADREAKKALEDKAKAQEKLNKLQEEGMRAAFKLRAEQAKEQNEKKKQQQDDTKRAATFILSREREKNADLQNAQAALRARREANAEMTAMSAAAIATFANLFGRNKAINIAAAIADTYAAAVKAYNISGGGVWGLPMMALTIAQGLAQVQQIRKAAPGFDDPVNDLLAESFGRKWAADFIRHVNAGFMSGLGNASTYNTYNINRGTTVNLGGVHGLIGSGTEFKKDLVRTLTQANRLERRTTS